MSAPRPWAWRLGGIPGVLIAAFVVKSLPLAWLRWLVVLVVLYAAIAMLRAAFTSAGSADSGGSELMTSMCGPLVAGVTSSSVTSTVAPGATISLTLLTNSGGISMRAARA